MAYKNFIKSVVFFLFFVLFKSVILFADTSPNLIPVTVLNVIDGDTITVSLPNGKVERVRYLLIDTPELHHPLHGKEEFSERACRLNGQLLELGDILLEFDVEKRDRYGRLLAYVWCRSSKEMFLINEELVRRGAAMPLIIPPNKKYTHCIQRALAHARREKAGLWGQASNRLFTSKEIWTFLPFLKGNFILASVTVDSVQSTPSKILLKDGAFFLVIYKSDIYKFRHLHLDKGANLTVMGKVEASYSGSEMIISDPLQIIKFNF